VRKRKKWFRSLPYSRSYQNKSIRQHMLLILLNGIATPTQHVSSIQPKKAMQILETSPLNHLLFGFEFGFLFF